MSEPIVISLALSAEQVDAIANRVALVVANEVIKAITATSSPATITAAAPKQAPHHEPTDPDFDPRWNGLDVIKSGKNEGKLWSQLPERTVDFLAMKPDGPAAARKERARIRAASDGRAYAQ
jgi:hypothetical protein